MLSHHDVNERREALDELSVIIVSLLRAAKLRAAANGVAGTLALGLASEATYRLPYLTGGGCRGYMASERRI